MEKTRRHSTGQVPSWIIAPPRSIGAWSRSGKDGNIEMITWRAGYGGVFTPDGKRASNAARGRLARCETLYLNKYPYFTCKHTSYATHSILGRGARISNYMIQIFFLYIYDNREFKANS